MEHMARIITHEDTGPYELKKAAITGEAVYICRCGLSRNGPFCDGSHTKARAEAKDVLLHYVNVDGKMVAQPVRVAPAANTGTNPSN
jgi:CDGSH-type Zn-finger protein